MRNRALYNCLREEIYHFLGVPKGLVGRFFVLAFASVTGEVMRFFSTRALQERFLMAEDAVANIERLQKIIFVIGGLFGCIVAIVIWNVWLSKRVTWKI